MCFRSTTARAAGSSAACVSVSCMEEPNQTQTEAGRLLEC